MKILEFGHMQEKNIYYYFLLCKKKNCLAKNSFLNVIKLPK